MATKIGYIYYNVQNAITEKELEKCHKFNPRTKTIKNKILRFLKTLKSTIEISKKLKVGRSYTSLILNRFKKKKQNLRTFQKNQNNFI